MSNRIKHIEKILYLLLVVLLVIPQYLDAQETKKKKKLRYRMRLDYKKDTKGDKILTAHLFYKEGPSFIDVIGETVSFSITGMEEERELAAISTNNEGVAILKIAAAYPIPWDEDGMCIFAARFEGNEKARPADNEVYITDIDIDFEFVEEDEERIVNTIISRKDAEGNIIPVYEAEVYAYVERMFSLLQIGGDFSDEEGKISFEFPEALPGDSLGNLKVIVRINESDEYGTVEKVKTIAWGIPVDYTETKPSRSLWTDEAPVWMSFAVLVMLAGAWFNFLLAIYRIYKVKKLGKNIEAQ